MKGLKTKTILSIAGFAILVAGIIGGILLVRQNQDIRERAAPATSIKISPTTQSKKQGDNFTFYVVMDTDVNQVTGIDIRLNFNQNLLNITSIEKGSDITIFDNEINNTFSNQTGKISYSVFTINKTKAVTGSNLKVLKVNGSVKNAVTGTATINFDSNSVISGVNEGQNVISSKASGNIIINTATIITPTPTTIMPISTKSPSPTPRPMPTLTQNSTSEPISITTSIATAKPIPVTGNSFPTFFAIGLGLLAIFRSLILAF